MGGQALHILKYALYKVLLLLESISARSPPGSRRTARPRLPEAVVVELEELVGLRIGAEQLVELRLRHRRLPPSSACAGRTVGGTECGVAVTFYRGYKNIYGQKYWEYMGRQITEILEKPIEKLEKPRKPRKNTDKT